MTSYGPRWTVCGSVRYSGPSLSLRGAHHRVQPLQRPLVCAGQLAPAEYPHRQSLKRRRRHLDRLQGDPCALAVRLQADLEACITGKPRGRLAVKPLGFVAPLQAPGRVPAGNPLVDLGALPAPVPVDAMQAAITLAFKDLGCLGEGQPLR